MTLCANPGTRYPALAQSKNGTDEEEKVIAGCGTLGSRRPCTTYAHKEKHSRVFRDPYSVCSTKKKKKEKKRKYLAHAQETTYILCENNAVHLQVTRSTQQAKAATDGEKLIVQLVVVVAARRRLLSHGAGLGRGW